MFLDTLQKFIEIATDADVDKFAGYIKDIAETVGKVAIVALEYKIKKEELKKSRGSGNQFGEAYLEMMKKRKKTIQKMDDAKAELKDKSGSITAKIKRANEFLKKYDLEQIKTDENTPMQTAVKIQQELVKNAENEILQETDLSRSAEKAELAIIEAKRKGADTIFLGESIDTTARNIMVVKDRVSPQGKKEPQVIVRRTPTNSLPEWLSYEPCLAQVNIADKKTGTVRKENLLAYYCKDLNCFFVSSSEYERAMSIGAILATTKEQYNLVFSKDGDRVFMTDKSTKGKNTAEKKATCTLRECGYFVGSKNALSKKTVDEIIEKSAAAGEKIPKEISNLMLAKRKLLDSERHAILKYAIEERGLSPKEVTDFLEQTKKRQEASLKSRGIKSNNVKSYEKDIAFIKETYAKDLQEEKDAEHLLKRQDKLIGALERQKELLTEKLDYTKTIEYRESIIFGGTEKIDEERIMNEINAINSELSELSGAYAPTPDPSGRPDKDIEEKEEDLER